MVVATLVGVGLTARLGMWQLDRAARKEALQASLDTRNRLPALSWHELATTAEELAPQFDRKVRLRGRWQHDATRFLENRQMNGRPGFYVVTPLLAENAAAGDAILVQRGWVARDPLDRARLPVLPTSSDIVELPGRIGPWPGRLYDFGGIESGPIRQNLDRDAYARETRLRLRPLSVLQVEAPGSPADGLLREWPRPAAEVHRHYGYAFQWFALSALIAGLYVWFHLVRPRIRSSR